MAVMVISFSWLAAGLSLASAWLWFRSARVTAPGLVEQIDQFRPDLAGLSPALIAAESGRPQRHDGIAAFVAAVAVLGSLLALLLTDWGQMDYTMLALGLSLFGTVLVVKSLYHWATTARIRSMGIERWSNAYQMAAVLAAAAGVAFFLAALLHLAGQPN